MTRISSAALFRACTSLGGLPIPGPVVALAGIARPQRFFDLLSASGWQVAGTQTFRDHHWYSRGELDRIAGAVRSAGAHAVVTTEKDLVRLLPFRPFPVPIVAAPLEFSIEPAADFRAWLFTHLGSGLKPSHFSHSPGSGLKPPHFSHSPGSGLKEEPRA